jgi:hypothetical protein
VVARLAPAPFDESSAQQASARLAAARALAPAAAMRVRAADAALGQARRDAERTRQLLDAGAVAPRALAAYVVEAERARERAVQVGEMGGVTVQVERGLAAGDRVIVFPSDQIRDGSRVRALRERLDTGAR